MTNKVSNIISLLKANQGELYTDGAFRFFIDNQIDVNELKEILAAENIVLPDEFYNLPIYEQKRYRTKVLTEFTYLPDEDTYTEYTVFNKAYFYDLVEHARKTIQYTAELINYLNNINSKNITFLGMNYVNIKNSRLRVFSSLMDYVSKKGITDLYSLVIDLGCNLHPLVEEIQLKNLLNSWLKKKEFLNFDLDEPINKFFLLVENLLNDLPRKEANTIRIKFHILEESYLRGELDYYVTNKPVKWLIKDYKNQGYFKQRSIRLLKDFVSKNTSLISGMRPNGYMVFYYAFIESEEK